MSRCAYADSPPVQVPTVEHEPRRCLLPGPYPAVPGERQHVATSVAQRVGQKLRASMMAADQGIFFGAVVPSDHLSARTNRTVTRSCGSFATMTGELGSSAAHVFVMSPGE